MPCLPRFLSLIALHSLLCRAFGFEALSSSSVHTKGDAQDMQAASSSHTSDSAALVVKLNEDKA